MLYNHSSVFALYLDCWLARSVLYLQDKKPLPFISSLEIWFLNYAFPLTVNQMQADIYTSLHGALPFGAHMNTNE
jgi:hypothetical protein